MKNFLKNQTRPQWQPSIFHEGMRQLRLAGIVYVIITAVSALVSAYDYYYSDYFQKHYVISENISYIFDNVVNVTAVCSSVFMAAALLYISPFLRSGKARDFYCSTPHSLGTIWLNFAAAAYAWSLIGIVGAYLVTMPYPLINDVKTIGVCLQSLAGNLAFSLLIFGIVMLAITLTGRIINAVVTMLGLMLAPSMMWGAFHAAENYYYSRFAFVRYPNGLTCPDPFAYIVQSLDIIELFRTPDSRWNVGFDSFGAGKTIVYCLVMGIVYIAAALFFASVRTGDTAGRPFVNRAAHSLSFLSVILPLFCWGAAMAINFLNHKLWSSGYQTYEYVIEAALIVLLLAALYWVVELLLTFDIRHAHRAYKYIAAPIVIALGLAGTGYLCATAAFTTTLEPNEVESFSLARNNVLDNDLAIFRLSNTYGRTVTEDSSFRDAETIQYITARINEYVKLYRENPRKAYQQSPDWFEYNEFDEEYTDADGVSYISIKLHLKNGGQMTRAVKFDKEHAAKLAAVIKNDKEYMKKFLAMPDSEKLNIRVNQEGLTSDEVQTIYESFVQEYNALSDEQKLAYRKKNLYNHYVDDDDNDDVTVILHGAAGAPQSVSGVVSETDIKLVSQSVEKGEYYIDRCAYYKPGDLNGNHEIELQIMGYADGHLYDSNYSFDESYMFDLKSFPKTHALTVKLCNAKIAELVKTVGRERNNNEIVYLHINANYHSAESRVDMRYNWIGDALDLKYARSEYQSYWLNEYYEYDTDESQIPDATVVEVDTAAMLEKLLDDAVATGESVDFSQPYCEVSVFGANEDDLQYDFFVQTKLTV